MWLLLDVVVVIKCGVWGARAMSERSLGSRHGHYSIIEVLESLLEAFDCLTGAFKQASKKSSPPTLFVIIHVY